MLLDHLNDSSRYEVVAMGVFHRLKLCGIGTVSDKLSNIFLSMANIGPLGSDPPIPLCC
jgi:hypothetical protein